MNAQELEAAAPDPIQDAVDQVAVQAGLTIARLRIANDRLEKENENLATLLVKAQEDVRQLEEQLTLHRHLGLDLELAEGRIGGLEAKVDELEAVAKALDLPVSGEVVS